jgi:tRNA dimethylallyltransferase
MYINGELPYGDAVELLKKNTRNYAKRQLTWFRRDPSVIWSYPDENGTDAIFENIVNIAKKHLN